MTKPKNIIMLLGQSGCGKDTQSDLLRQRLLKEDTFYISSGDQLRDFTKSTGALAESIRQNNNNGKLSPMAALVYAITSYINTNYRGESTVLWNGSPRSMFELEILAQFADFWGAEGFYILHMNVSDEECLRRIVERAKNSDREDTTNMDSIKNKLGFYNTDTIHVVNTSKHGDLSALRYAKILPNFLEVDGEGSIEEVYTRMEEKIKEVI